MLSMTSETCSSPKDPVQPALTLENNGKGMAKGGGFPKSDFRHWEARIYKPRYVENGARLESPLYTVRLAHRGRRASFGLGLANKREAAKKAGEIYKALISDGWEATLAKYRPDAPSPTPAPLAAVTVGEYITAASEVAEVAPRSLHDYAAMLRRLVAAVAGIKGGKNRFGPKKGGASKWRKTIDAQPLAVLTPERIDAWRLAHAKAAGNDPTAKRRAQSTANSTIRQAKALFSRGIIAKIGGALALPDPLPFEGVKYFPKGSTRYLSKIEPGSLMAAARRDLGLNPTRSEEWKIFLLALLCGLRRREIDTLTWKQCDFNRRTIHIEETIYFRPKSHDSTGEIDLDEEAAEILKKLKAKATGEFVIESDAAPRPQSALAYYRAERHFEALNEWLRQQGITARKPLHELRKEAGSLVAQEHGLFGAQRFLRHSKPNTTADYYLDKKARVTTGLGGLLSTPATGGDTNSD
jgi:integrase